MLGTIKLNGTRRRLRLPPYKDANVMAINTGLSVTVAGHYVYLKRDEQKQVAEVCVNVIEGHQVTGLENEAVIVAARLLAERAQRFLGRGWRIVPYSGGQALAQGA